MSFFKGGEKCTTQKTVKTHERVFVVIEVNNDKDPLHSTGSEKRRAKG